MNPLIKYYIALSKLENVGPILGKNLISYCGGVKEIFELPGSRLLKVPGIGKNTLSNIVKSKERAVDLAEREMEFCNSNKIDIYSFNDNEYPNRLKLCSDCPVVIFKKGNADLNSQRIVSVIGTRRCTDYGKSILRKFIPALKEYNIKIVSGLAYGIDYYTHKNAVENDLCNIAVLAHGLDRIYPSGHKKLSKEICRNGALISEFTTGTNPDRENFPKRNRIVAGMCDATIVVESSIKGGAIITAYLAQSYNRDVFAFPGKINDDFSAGCNNLIKKNIAGLIESADDLIYQLGWKEDVEGKQNKIIQTSLLLNLNEDEDKIVELLRKFPDGLSVDVISVKSQTSLSKIAATLLMLEMNNIVEAVPGNKYRLF